MPKYYKNVKTGEYKEKIFLDITQANLDVEMTGMNSFGNFAKYVPEEEVANYSEYIPYESELGRVDKEV